MRGLLRSVDLPDDFRLGYVALARESTGVPEYLMPPLPNTLYTRDTTCGSTIWWGDPEQEWGLATLEGAM